MKKVLFFLTLAGSSFLCAPAFSQTTPGDSLGLPGDNLNLYGVLNLFQESPTLEDFEKKLNAEDTKLNNLDLNGDEKADYIKVIDNVQGTSHAIVLQVAVNDKETQDVAVINVTKDKNDQVDVQIIGDEALYGKDYIVEPSDSTATAGATPNPGYKQKSTTTQNGGTITNNYYNSGPVYPASHWAIVHYMYTPTYVVYVSPWYWGYYPTYWHPWHPWYFHAYYNHWYHYPHYGYYHRTQTYRDPGFNSYYGPRRSVSVTVNQRRETGAYRSTYSRPDLGPGGANRRETNAARPGNQTREQSATPRNNAPRTNQAPRTNSAPRSNTQSAPRTNQAPRSSSPAPRQQRSTSAPRSSTPHSSPAPRGGGGGRSGGGGGHRGR